MILSERYPVPKFIICAQGDSLGQERLLKNKVIPTSQTGNQEIIGDEFSEDVSLSVFMNHLVKLAVQAQT